MNVWWYIVNSFFSRFSAASPIFVAQHVVNTRVTNEKNHRLLWCLVREVERGRGSCRGRGRGRLGCWHKVKVNWRICHLKYYCLWNSFARNKELLSYASKLKEAKIHKNFFFPTHPIIPHSPQNEMWNVKCHTSNLFFSSFLQFLSKACVCRVSINHFNLLQNVHYAPREVMDFFFFLFIFSFEFKYV